MRSGLSAEPLLSFSWMDQRIRTDSSGASAGRVVSAGPSFAGPFPGPLPGPLPFLETISGRLGDTSFPPVAEALDAYVRRRKEEIARDAA